MSNTKRYAELELSILSKSATDPNNRPVVEEFIPEILSLCDKFGMSGQSGGSAPYTATILAKTVKSLCLHRPICPITGIDDEWVDVAERNEWKSLYQNKRCSALFKEGVAGLPYYLDAIVVKDQFGIAYTSNCGCICKDGTKIYSRQNIKSFPFTPKTFYIDVIEKEDDVYIKDEKQLKKVFKYYDRYYETKL